MAIGLRNGTTQLQSKHDFSSYQGPVKKGFPKYRGSNRPGAITSGSSAQDIRRKVPSAEPHAVSSNPETILNYGPAGAPDQPIQLNTWIGGDDTTQEGGIMAISQPHDDGSIEYAQQIRSSMPFSQNTIQTADMGFSKSECHTAVAKNTRRGHMAQQRSFSPQNGVMRHHNLPTGSYRPRQPKGNWFFSKRSNMNTSASKLNKATSKSPNRLMKPQLTPGNPYSRS